MKAVISVVGTDSVGIIAMVSGFCAKYGVNIQEISQTVLQEYFVMIMVTNIDKITIPFAEFVDLAAKLGTEKHLEIHAMHSDIFHAMHHI